MSNLCCSEEEFRADVEALQAEYEAKSKALMASMDREQFERWAQRGKLPTATGPGARGDWSYDPAGQKKINQRNGAK